MGCSYIPRSENYTDGIPQNCGLPLPCCGSSADIYLNSFYLTEPPLQPVDAITARAKLDGTTVTSSLSDTDLNAAASTAAGKDVAFVFITADSGYATGPIHHRLLAYAVICSEGYITVENNAGDRNDLSAWHGGVSSKKLLITWMLIYPL